MHCACTCYALSPSANFLAANFRWQRCIGNKTLLSLSLIIYGFSTLQEEFVLKTIRIIRSIIKSHQEIGEMGVINKPKKRPNLAHKSYLVMISEALSVSSLPRIGALEQWWSEIRRQQIHLFTKTRTWNSRHFPGLNDFRSACFSFQLQIFITLATFTIIKKYFKQW